MKLTIPFNGEADYLAALDAAGCDWRRVSSVYAAPNPLIVGTARKPKVAASIAERDGRLHFDAAGYDVRLVELIRQLGARGVGVSLLLNAATPPPDAGRLREYVAWLYHEHSLTDTIVGSLELIETLRLKMDFPALRVHSSVIMGIRTADQAKRAADQGLDVLLLPPEINRDLAAIERLRRVSALELKLMVNEGCKPFCADRGEHFRAAAEYSVHVAMADLRFDRPPDLSAMTCRTTFNDAPELLLRVPWVRPEDLGAYEGLVDHVKVVGRSFSSSKLARVVRGYMTRSYDGDLRDLVETFKHIAVPLLTRRLTEEEWRHCTSCRLPMGQCPACGACAAALVGTAPALFPGA